MASQFLVEWENELVKAMNSIVRWWTPRSLCRILLTESKVCLVYGQMNEPPGSRMRVGLSALTVAEYFREDLLQDVLLFIDNIFRFVQAGSEVSALLGRLTSAVGYQPTLASELGSFQERITSTRNGSITSHPSCLCASR